MEKILLVWVLGVSLAVFAEEGLYYDYETEEGITVEAERPRPEFPPESTEAYILSKLHKLSKDKENFIKEELLENAGFRSTGNVKFRKSTGSEKALSLLHGAAHTLSFGIVPMKPFLEIEYAKLPQGAFYHFESVIYASPFRNVSTEVRTAMELEYKLQVEFCNGVLIRNWNEGYYTGKNIAGFEELAWSLPDSPPSIRDLKNRYLNEELPKIKAAWERRKNPSEQVLRAGENLGDWFR
ncbi:MAG: hypothetical protein LBD55_06560 [Treponema sp.]|jgi:hypothetical protein|nr:hypothetical protein [Treponema sp.]